MYTTQDNIHANLAFSQKDVTNWDQFHKKTFRKSVDEYATSFINVKFVKNHS